MNLNLSDKRAIVCGSTQGIGKSTALELSKLGAEVTLIARNEEALKKVCNELSTERGQNHTYLVADFDRPKDLEKTLDESVTGKMNVSILVNNTGGPAGGLAIDADVEEYRIAFNRHLICNQLLVKSVVSGMKKLGYGRVVNIISTSVKAPIEGLGVSNTIRGAVANWAKTLANELGPFGITVNNLLPGATSTARLDSIITNRAEKMGVTKEQVIANWKEGIPARRFADPEEIAHVAAFLASPSAGYVNGINVPVDGGRLSCL